MRIRRRLPIWFGVLLIVAAIALGVVLRKHAPPESARLLPAADGFAFVNLRWIRRANVTGQLPAAPHDPEYEQFIQATGFQFERDLDQAAFAIHYGTSLPVIPGTAPQPRFSEIFVGRIDGEKLRAYLQKLATAVESDGSVDIYSIPLEGRTLRVAILSVDTVAASNHPDPEVIRAIVERSRKLASPFGGPALLRQYYKHVPLASLAWAIFKVDPALSRAGSPGIMDFSMLFSKPAAVVASARYLGSIHLRAEAFTESADEARHVSEQLETFLTIFHTAETAMRGPSSDPDLKEFLSSLKVQQNNQHVALTAIVPPAFLRKAVAEPPGGLLPSAPARAPSN